MIPCYYYYFFPITVVTPNNFNVCFVVGTPGSCLHYNIDRIFIIYLFFYYVYNNSWSLQIAFASEKVWYSDCSGSNETVSLVGTPPRATRSWKLWLAACALALLCWRCRRTINTGIRASELASKRAAKIEGGTHREVNLLDI